MSVDISSATVVTSLWPVEDAAAIPVHSSGEFLSLRLLPHTDNAVASVAFHPVDETCFVLGTQSGRAYGVSLQENKLFLLADLSERGALRCATFCPGYLTRPIVVFASSDNRLVFLDWQRGTVLQDVAAAAHERPITQLVTGATTEPLFSAVSADAVSCWEPVEDDRVTHSTAASAAGTGDRGASSVPTPHYGCSGSAVPTQTLERVSATSPTVAAGKVAHRFLDVHVLRPTLLFTVETNGVLSLWSRSPAGADDAVADTATGGAAAQQGRLRLQRSAAAPSVLRLRCSTRCGALIALGADAATTDDQGDQVEPVVAFVVADTVEGAGVVRLPSRTGSAAPRERVVTVTQVRALHSDCIACLLNTGMVHVVLPSTFHLVFSIHPPALGGPGPRLGPRSRWSFTPSGPTFGAMWREHVLVLLHLPTARRSDGGVTAPGEGAATAQPESVAGAGRSSGRRRVSATDSLRHGDGAAAGVVMAHSFLRPAPLPARHAAAAAAGAASGSAAAVTAPVSSTAAGVEAALAALSARRPLVTVPRRGFPELWADVNEVDVRTRRSEDAAASSSPPPPPQQQPLPTVTAAFCDSLSAESCRYNVGRLHSHLLQHGVYPHPYRPAIWRFLAGLPRAAKTASQFAALARRPVHLAVSQLMAPFPLSPSPTRTAVEVALSCLCWASPVFTLAAYLPVLVYPLTLLFHDDVQSVVELVLAFFQNWGRDFFTCHPHGPAALLVAMERQLRRLDEPLCQHLDAVGAGAAVWGWELQQTFLTDVLTGAEWLQVMDHVMTAAPLWLFAFHVTLVRTRLRPALLSALSLEEVRGVFRGAPTAPAPAHSGDHSLQRLIEDCYRLQRSWADECTDVTHDLAYLQSLQTLSAAFVYPSHISHDPVVLAEKLRELSHLQRSRDEEKRAADRLETLRRAAEAASAKEAAFVQQQRARVAAKYEASAASWQVHVAVERGRQEREAEERQLRWDALQERTRNAEELELLGAEVNMVESQLRHDLVDRHMEQLKWRLAAHLTDEELARLQTEADAQVERAVRRIEEGARQHAEDMARCDDAPPLCVTAAAAEPVDAVGATSEAHTDGPRRPTASRVEEEEANETGTTSSSVQSPDLVVHAVSPSSALSLVGPAQNTHDRRHAAATSHAPPHRAEATDRDSPMPSSREVPVRTAAAPSHQLTSDDTTNTPGAVRHRGSPSGTASREGCDAAPGERGERGGSSRHGSSSRSSTHRAPPPPLPRHAYGSAATEWGWPALTQQRFLELRDRVLSRVDAYSRATAAEDPLRRYRPAYHGDTTTTATTTTTAMTTATASSATGTTTASCTTSSAEPMQRRRLFDNYDPNRRHVEAERMLRRYAHPPRGPETPSSYSARTTTSTSAAASVSPDSTSATATVSHTSPTSYTSYAYDYTTTTATRTTDTGTSQRSSATESTGYSPHGTGGHAYRAAERLVALRRSRAHS
ncbi:hypothetical protein NESM_000111500 [Novymonas esmeraldas]|uniref:Rab-GAP TBC domain-containing protein n=1 Tax=Novymonas esmeraldas TaxID=1808958 RepID=A0AAW0F2B4_9TRYP